jgi:hypothetical protein
MQGTEDGAGVAEMSFTGHWGKCGNDSPDATNGCMNEDTSASFPANSLRAAAMYQMGVLSLATRVKTRYGQQCKGARIRTSNFPIHRYQMLLCSSRMEKIIPDDHDPMPRCDTVDRLLQPWPEVSLSSAISCGVLVGTVPALDA